jgi:hypothetical protein
MRMEQASHGLYPAAAAAAAALDTVWLKYTGWLCF